MAQSVQDRSKSPRELARYLGVGLDKVLAWIHAGKINAIDVGGVPGKPRFKITPEALAAFLAARRVIARPAAKVRRKARPAGWIERY